MKLLIITLYYPPVISSLATMMDDVARQMQKAGHDVTVLTPRPRYNLSQEDLTVDFAPFQVEDGIKVFRLKTANLKPTSFIMRGIAQVLLPLNLWLKRRQFLQEDFDAVLLSTPPLPFTMFGNWLKKKCNAFYFLHVQDIFPQNAIDLGVMNNRWAIRFFERMEARAYQRADLIASHTISSRKFLIENKNNPPDKVIFLPNWIDVDAYAPQQRVDFRKRYGVEDRFVLLFAGVIGPAQGFDLIIDAARIVDAEAKEITFLVLAEEGPEKSRIENRVRHMGLKNIRFKPFISQAEYPLLLQEVDAGLICLSPKNKTPVVPGKILGYMAASLPVVAFLNQESDGHEVIARAGCGYSRISDDPAAAADLILKLYRQRSELGRMGRKGLDYVAKNYSKRVWLEKIETLLTSRGPVAKN